MSDELGKAAPPGGDGAVPKQHPPDGAAAAPPKPSPPSNQAGRDQISAEFHSVVTNGPSYFNLGGGSAATTKPARSRPPARRAALPAPFPAELLDVTPSVSLLARERFLVIECPHQGQQWRSAAAVLRTLAGEAASFTDRIDDDGYQAAARSSGDVDPNPRWDLEDLEHPELPSEAKVLILELTGSAGRARYDSLLGSPGSRRALTSTLERTGRYLVLLAASRNAPRATGACEGLPVLAVPFLSLWLKERYPSDHQRLAALLHDKLTQHDWESEEAVFDWLCQRPHDLSAEALIADLSGQCGEPKPIAAVRQALERCDEKDEVFLTAIFVAAYLPSLSPYEFSEVMTALLGQRTREDERASPRPSGGEPGMPPAPAQLSLAVEWAQTSRQVMARGDLVLQPSVSGAGSAVVFRAQRAPLALRRELDAAPFFLDAQLEHLRESGLLFHSHGAVRAAVIQLLVRVARQAPLRTAPIGCSTSSRNGASTWGCASWPRTPRQKRPRRSCRGPSPTPKISCVSWPMPPATAARSAAQR